MGTCLWQKWQKMIGNYYIKNLHESIKGVNVCKERITSQNLAL